MPEVTNMELERNAREAARWLAGTPGVLVLKVEPAGAFETISAKERSAMVFESSRLPQRISLPIGASSAKVVAFGAFEPTRPTDTPETLLAELNRERKSLRLESLPRGTDVKSLGFDDLGFLTFQITMTVGCDSDPSAGERELCTAA